jgi:hypothetical protein
MLRQYKQSILFLAVILGVAAASREALASHKSWILKNGGNQCQFNGPLGDLSSEWNYDSLGNYQTYPRAANCPVSLSGRWGSSSPAMTVPLQAGAWAATVYVNNQSTDGSSFSCTAAATLGAGLTINGIATIYYSRSVTTSVAGQQTMVVAWGGDWGGALETNESQNLRTLSFQCTVPPSSAINGYKVRICQNRGFFTDCTTTPTDNGESSGNGGVGTGTNFSQTSGIECNDYGAGMQRGFNGITNPTGNAGFAGCPIIPPVDDTTEYKHKINVMQVYFSSPSGEIPYCYIRSFDRADMAWHYSSALTYDPLTPRFEFLNAYSIGWDVNATVGCTLPSGATIHGVVTNMSVSPVVNAG